MRRTTHRATVRSTVRTTDTQGWSRLQKSVMGGRQSYAMNSTPELSVSGRQTIMDRGAAISLPTHGEHQAQASSWTESDFYVKAKQARANRVQFNTDHSPPQRQGGGIKSRRGVSFAHPKASRASGASFMHPASSPSQGLRFLGSTSPPSQGDRRIRFLGSTSPPLPAAGRPPSPKDAHMVRFVPDEEGGGAPEFQFLPSQKPNIQFSREKRHKTLANMHQPSREHAFKTIPLSEEQQKIEERKQYIAKAERRHTSARGRSFISKKPDLMSQLKMYYHPEDADEDHLDHIKDSGLYTNQKLLERESLKFEPRVLNVLDEIWQVTDRNHDGSVDRDEYIKMSTKLYCAVVGDGDIENAKEVAEKEWVHDCFGYDDLDRNRFTQSWFQLADMWTDGLEVDEYVNFLTDVLVCLTDTTADGERKWRDDGEIITIADYQKKKEEDAKEVSPLIEIVVKPKKAKKKRAAAFQSRMKTELPEWKRSEKAQSSGPGWGWGGNKSKAAEDGGVGFYGGEEKDPVRNWGRQVKLTAGAVNALRRTFKASKASKRIFQRMLEKVAKEKDAELPEAKVHKREAAEIQDIVRAHARQLCAHMPVVVLEPEDELKRDQKLITDAVRSISEKLVRPTGPEQGSPMKFAMGADLVRAMSSIGCSFDPMEIVKLPPRDDHYRVPQRPQLLQSKTAVNVMGGGFSVRHKESGDTRGGSMGSGSRFGLGAQMNSPSFNPAFHPVRNPGDTASLYRKFGGSDFLVAPEKTQYRTTPIKSKQSYPLRAKKSATVSPHAKLHASEASMTALEMSVRHKMEMVEKPSGRLKMMIATPEHYDPDMAAVEGPHSWMQMGDDGSLTSSPSQMQAQMQTQLVSSGSHGGGRQWKEGVSGDGYGEGGRGTGGFSNVHQLSLPVVPMVSVSSSAAGASTEYGFPDEGAGQGASIDHVDSAATNYRGAHGGSGGDDAFGDGSSVFTRSSHANGRWIDDEAGISRKSAHSRIDANLVAEPLPSRNATKMLHAIRDNKLEIDQAAFGSKLKKGYTVSTNRLTGAEKWTAGSQ